MDSPYEDGRWTINVQLPKNYPYSSPSIGFVERIYHPNIDLKYPSPTHPPNLTFLDQVLYAWML